MLSEKHLQNQQRSEWAFITWWWWMVIFLLFFSLNWLIFIFFLNVLTNPLGDGITSGFSSEWTHPSNRILYFQYWYSLKWSLWTILSFHVIQKLEPFCFKILILLWLQLAVEAISNIRYAKSFFKLNLIKFNWDLYLKDCCWSLPWENLCWKIHRRTSSAAWNC